MPERHPGPEDQESQLAGPPHDRHQGQQSAPGDPRGDLLAGATKAIDLATPRGRDAVLTAIEQTGASYADTADYPR